MCIIVLRYWRLTLYSLFIIEIVGVGLTFLCFQDDILAAISFSCYSIVTMSLLQILCLIVQHRFLGHVIYENGTYVSCFFTKKLCKINENDGIFYAKIHGRISAFHYADFVLISKDPFEYWEVPTIRWFPWNPKPLLVSYNVKQMILLPYDENGIYLTNISKWKRIFPSETMSSLNGK